LVFPRTDFFRERAFVNTFFSFFASTRRSAPLLILVALAAVVGAAGCLGDTDYRPEASGPAGEVTVVVDSARWNGAVGEALRETLGRPIMTLPVAEPSFDLRQIDLTPANLERVQRHKNILIAAALTDSSQEAEFLRQQFSPEARQAIESGGGTVVPRPDLWRRRQQVFYVAASTPQELAATIRQRGPALRDTLDSATRRRAYENMFERGRQVEIEDSLMTRHSFALNVQHDYVLAQDTLFTGVKGRLGGFVLLVRKLPDTWRRLFVWYKENADPAQIERDWILSMRDSLAGRYLRGRNDGAAYSDRRQTITMQEIDYLARYAYETRGIWYMSSADTSAGRDSTVRRPLGGAGPFINYTFYDQQQDRIYMIDGTIFAPDYDKREFLRQMEVIAYTFRTRPEVAQRRDQQTAER
jgi:hypothetical protein